MIQEVTVLLGDPRIRDSSSSLFHRADLIAIEKMHSALAELERFRFRYVNEHKDLAKAFRASPPKFIFNLCNNGFRNKSGMEGHIPALLDMLSIAYSGSGSACLATCYDEGLVRCLAQNLGVPVPREKYLPLKEPLTVQDITFPVQISASSGVSNKHIDRIAASIDEARDVVAHFREVMPSQCLSVKELLQGPEYLVGLIGNPSTGVDVLPILERPTGPTLRSVTADRRRRDADGLTKPARFREANLTTEARRSICKHAATLFERLNCRDYAVVEFCADHNGQIKLLSVKPNPDWCWDGPLAAMATFRGLRYADLFAWVLNVSLARGLNTNVLHQQSNTVKTIRPPVSKPTRLLRAVSP